VGVPVGVPEAEATAQFNQSFPFSLVASRLVADVKLVNEFHVVAKPLLARGSLATMSVN
jgi:hypothetical protein